MGMDVHFRCSSSFSADFTSAIDRLFQTAESANSLPFAWNGCLFMWVPIFVWVLINVMWLL